MIQKREQWLGKHCIVKHWWARALKIAIWHHTSLEQGGVAFQRVLLYRVGTESRLFLISREGTSASSWLIVASALVKLAHRLMLWYLQTRI